MNRGILVTETASLTRSTTEEAIKKLDYHPNEMARSLVTKKTRTIAFVINDIASQFSGILLRHSGEILRKEGFSLMICDSGHDKSREAENIRFCIEKQVDGIMLLPVSQDGSFLEPAEKANVPVVLLDREVKEQKYDSVTIDNRNAAERAVNRLIQCGHKRIAVIHLPVLDIVRSPVHLRHSTTRIVSTPSSR